MRKFFSLSLIVAILVAVTLTSTSGLTSAQDDTVKLTFTIWGSTGDVDVYNARLALMKEVYPNIEVEIVYVPSDYDQKVLTMIAGGTPPDIMQVAEGVHAYSDRGQLAGLNEYVKAAGLDLEARFGSLAATYTRNDELYALPDRGGAMIVYYNKAMFDAASIAYPTAEWTWDDMLAAAQALTLRNGDEVTQWGFAAGGWWPWWMSFIYQNGGRILDGRTPVVNTPEVKEALQFYVDLMYKYKVAPTPEDYANAGLSFGQPDPLFSQGKVAFELTGFWLIGSLQNIPELSWDIAPVWQQKERATVAFGSGLAITNDCAHKDEAFKVIEFLTSAEGQLPIVEMGEDAPVNLDLLNSEAWLSGEYLNADINMSTFAESAPAIFTPPLEPEWNEIQQIFDDNLSEVWIGSRSVDDALEQIQSDLEFLLES
jgi:multiple sugar transport system substrate-binding protein